MLNREAQLKIIEQAKNARQRKALTNKALGKGSKANYAKCPHRSKAKLRILREYEKENNVEIRCSDCDNGGICEACCCSRVAGDGTNHRGWGLCSTHEKGLMKKTADNMAIDHKNALQARSSTFYDVPEQYLPTLKMEAELAKDSISVFEEYVLMKGQLQNLINDTQDRQLTEIVGGEEMAMSDKTRINLTAKLADQIGKMALVDRKLKEEDVIHKEVFQIWLFKMVNLFKEVLDDDELYKIFVGRMGAEVGEPSFGKVK